MGLEHFQPSSLPKPFSYGGVAGYSHAVKAGNMLCISGQVARDGAGRMVGAGDIAAQATQVFENLKMALTASGARFENVVKLTVYLTDRNHRQTVGDVRARYFTGPLPASTMILAELLDPEALLEIDAIAVVE